MFLVQLQGGHGILNGAVGNALLLDDHSQLVLCKNFELLGNVSGARRIGGVGCFRRVEGFHEWFILGRVAGGIPRMSDSKHAKIVLETMSYQHFVLEEGAYGGLGLVEGDSIGGCKIFCSDARDKGAVIGNCLDNFHMGVVDGFAIPVDKGDAGEARLVAIWSDSYHFAVKGNIKSFFSVSRLRRFRWNVDGFGTRGIFRFFGAFAALR
mmetsp:Transcript_43938/g.75022  ORF Transcript_43938/g.75022 Transcript_43938/m.75022 type:complete len:209 (-) Transcript_43938:465-1091(-)